MGVHPLLHQQGDGRTRVNHQEALSSLALRLVTPRDLPRSNADGDVWLVSWLLLGFSRLRPWLGRLEPAHRHTYLLDDEGIGRLWQDAQRIGFWGLQHRDGGVMTGSHHTQDIVLDLLCHMDTMALRAAISTLCTNSSSYSIACPVPSPVSLSVRLVIAEVS